MGRPSIYSQELADEICTKIASNGKGIKLLCAENPNWPNKDTIFMWLKNHPEFSDQYARAKQCQIEVFVDEILDIADDCSKDSYINAQGKKICDAEYIVRSRLRIDTRKWLASKLVPKVYGSYKHENIPDSSAFEKLIDSLEL